MNKLERVSSGQVWTPEEAIRRTIKLQNGALDRDGMPYVAGYIHHGHIEDIGKYDKLPAELRFLIDPLVLSTADYSDREPEVNELYAKFMAGRGLPGHPTVYFYKHPKASFNESITREGEEWRAEDILRTLAMVDFRIEFDYKPEVFALAKKKNPTFSYSSAYVYANTTRESKKTQRYVLDLALTNGIPRDEDNLIEFITCKVDTRIIEVAGIENPLDALVVKPESQQLIEGLEAVLIK